MRLREFFVSVAAKRLKAVEADPSISNQHEFNGINRFRDMLGSDDRSFPTCFLYLDDENDPVRAIGSTTWYDARRNNPDRAAEYRLYFPTNDVSQRFSPADLLIIGKRADDTLLILASPADSSVGDQLLWLFGLEPPNGDYIVRDAGEIDRDVDYVVRWVLESIGIEAPAPEADKDLLIRRFGDAMPTTRVFSEFARTQTTGCDPVADPDHAIIAWLETEERFFRAFERMLVEKKLREGFVRTDNAVDVDGFIAFSLGVQNRRKSRAGYALENHLDHIFRLSDIRYQRGVTTEGKSKPDFLFPGAAEYAAPEFNPVKLAILGAKASCKDRWRQILGEADRVKAKHLCTLEPSISVNQTNEMKSRDVQLVLPKQIHQSYTNAQQPWLWTVMRFIEHIRQQQAS